MASEASPIVEGALGRDCRWYLELISLPEEEWCCCRECHASGELYELWTRPDELYMVCCAHAEFPVEEAHCWRSGFVTTSAWSGTRSSPTSIPVSFT